MNRETLFDAVTGIREEYIEEADPSQRKARRIPAAVLRAAAVLLVVAGLTAVALNLPAVQNLERAESAESTMDVAAGGSVTTAAAAAARDAEPAALEEQALTSGAECESKLDSAEAESALFLFRNGAEYRPTDLVDALPAGFTMAGEISLDAAEEFYLADETMEGCAVYESEAQPQVLYVAVSGGYQGYTS